MVSDHAATMHAGPYMRHMLQATMHAVAANGGWCADKSDARHEGPDASFSSAWPTTETTEAVQRFAVDDTLWVFRL